MPVTDAELHARFRPLFEKIAAGAGKVAGELEENQSEAAAEGRPGAIDPATDQRVPSH